MKRYSHYENMAEEWFVKSFDRVYNSDEWKVCRLNSRINHKKAVKELNKASKYLNEYPV